MLVIILYGYDTVLDRMATLRYFLALVLRRDRLFCFCLMSYLTCLISKCLFLFMRPNNSFPLDFRLHHIIYHSNSNAIIEDWQCIRAMSCFTARFEFGIKHAWTYASIECCIEVLVGVYSKRATKQDIFKYRACQ